MTGKSMVSTQLDQALYEKLEQAAQALGITRSALVRLLIRRGLSVPVVLSTETAPPPSD